MPIRVYYEVLNQKGTPALYSDNYAQRPAAGYVGRIFYSPDTAQIFYDTGSTWTLLADAGVGSGSLASVCANGNTTATGISITAGGLSANSITNTSFTQGWLMYAGLGGIMAGNPNLFYDATNYRLGLNTNNPGVTLDIHGTGTLVQLNGTGTNNSYLQFQNAGTGKWRIGNQYQGGANSFGIFNNSLSANAMTIDSTSNVTFVSNVTASSLYLANGINFVVTGGQTTITGSPNGISIQFPTTFSQTLTFPTGVAYTYTFPSATGTLLTATSFTSGVIPKYNSTAGTLTESMLSDDGTSVTSSGATRSNLYIKAVNNTYYGQLAFTNGSNGSYGGLSYNNASQYMQFEANGSEYIRLYGNGNLRLFTSSATDLGYKFQVEGTQQIDVSSGNNLIIRKGTGQGALVFGGTNANEAVFLQEGLPTGGIVFYTGSGTIPSATWTQIFTILSNGSASFGPAGSATSISRLVVAGASTTAADNSLIVTDSAGASLLQCRNDGYINVGTRANSPYNYTTGSGANAFLYSDGSFGRSTSSLKYKTDVLNYDKGLNLIKQLRPVYYKGINDGNKQFAGFIAEEVHDLGLTEFVQYAEDGSPDALAYQNMTALLTKGIQQIDDRLTALENKFN